MGRLPETWQGREGVPVSRQAAVESRQSWGKYPPMTPQKGGEKPPRSGFNPLTQTHPYLPQIRGAGGVPQKGAEETLQLPAEGRSGGAVEMPPGCPGRRGLRKGEESLQKGEGSTRKPIKPLPVRPVQQGPAQPRRSHTRHGTHPEGDSPLLHA